MMKKNISTFVLFFKKLFNQLKVFFKTMFAVINKKTWVVFLICFLSQLFSLSFAVFAVEQTPASISTSLYNVAVNYFKENNENPNGVIYSYKKRQNIDVLTYNMPEWASEIRDIYYNDVCFSLYQGGWDNYSPAVVNYVDETDVLVSMLLWPKESYIYPKWKYDMPLLASSLQTGLPSLSSPNDILVNEKYANYLLSNNASFSSYKDLLDLEVGIDYVWANSKVDYSETKRVNVNYVIKGVIDCNSDEYLSYQQKFGDFFIANEYLSLPIPVQTYFSFDVNSVRSRHKIQTLLNVYNYEAKKNIDSSNSSYFQLEYRVSFFGFFGTDLSILSVTKGENKFSSKTNAIFNYFNEYEYLIPLVTFSAFYLIFEIVSVVFFLKMYSLLSQYYSNELLKSATIFYCITISILCMFWSTVFVNIIHLLVPILKIITIRNYLSILICLISIALNIVISNVVWQKRRKKGQQKI